MPDSLFGPFEGLAGNGGSYKDVLPSLAPPPPIPAIPNPAGVLPPIVPQSGQAQPQPQASSVDDAIAMGYTDSMTVGGANPAQAIQALPGVAAQVATMPVATGAKLHGIYEAELQKQRIAAEQAEALLASGSWDTTKRDQILRSVGEKIENNSEFQATDDQDWQSIKNLAARKADLASRESDIKANRIAAEEAHKNIIEHTDKFFHVDKEDPLVKAVKWAGGVAQGVTEAAMVSTATAGTGLLPMMILDSRANAYRAGIDRLKADGKPLTPENTAMVANAADARGLITGLVLGVGGGALNKVGGVGKYMSSEVQESFIKDLAVKFARGTLMAAEQQVGDLTADLITSGENDWTRLKYTEGPNKGKDMSIWDKTQVMAKQFVTEAVTFGLGYEIGGNVLGLRRNAQVRRMAENYKNAEFGEGAAGTAKMLKDTAEHATALSVNERQELFKQAHVAEELAKLGYAYKDPATIKDGLKSGDDGSVSMAGSKEPATTTTEVPRSRNGEDILAELNKAESDALADLPTSLSPAMVDKSRSAAKVTSEEASNLNLVLKKMQDPRYAASPEGQAAFDAVKPIHDKIMEHREKALKERAVSDFMAGLSEEDVQALNDHLKSSKEVTKTEESAPATDNTPAPPLTSGEQGLLPIAHAEVKARNEAISNALATSGGVQEAVRERIVAEGGEYVDPASKPAKAVLKKIGELVKSGIPHETAMKSVADGGVLSTKEAQLYRDLLRHDALTEEVRESQRQRMHDQTVADVAEKHAPGSRGMLESLRKLQRGEIADPSQPMALTPGEIGEPRLDRRTITTNPEGRERIGTAAAKTLLEMRDRVLGKTLNSLPEPARLAAQKNHATSVRMARALKVMVDAYTKWSRFDSDKATDAQRSQMADAYRNAEGMVKAMGLSREERMRVENAYRDTVFASKTEGFSVLDASTAILEQAKLDHQNGLSPEAIRLNTEAAVASNKKIKEMVDYGNKLGIPTSTVLEAITSMADSARIDNLAPSKTGNKLTDAINEGLAANRTGQSNYFKGELSESKGFRDAVKELLKSMVPDSATEKADAPPPLAFDMSTADGKVRAVGYSAAMAYIREAKSQFFSYLGSKGNNLSDANKNWTRKTAQEWMNKVIAAQMQGADAPTNDNGKKTKRSWLLSTTDFTEITKALVEQGVLRAEGKGYVIVGMRSAAETVMGINPELIEKAWGVVPHNNDPTLTKLPTIQELFKDLTQEQLLVLQLYHGINSFAGVYMSEKQIADRIPGMSIGKVKEILDYSNKVIASRYPNFSLLADKYASEISRYLSPGEMYGDEHAENFRRNKLIEIQEALAYMAQMPGAMNAYTHKGTAANVAVSGDGVLLHKGFFPTLRDNIIDAGAPDHLLSERADAEKAFKEARDEYHEVSSKPDVFLTIAERREIEALRPIYLAARDRYLEAVGKVYSSVSLETRAMLDFVTDSMNRNRKREGGLESGNRRQEGVVSAVDRSRSRDIDNAEMLSNALGETLAEVLEGVNRDAFPRSETIGEIRATVIADAYHAYLENPNTPMKSAFTAAIMSLQNNRHAEMVGLDANGRPIVGQLFLDNIRASLNMTDRSQEVRTALAKSMADIRKSDALITTALGTRSKLAGDLDIANRRLDGTRASVAMYRSRIMDATKEVARNLFALRIADPTNVGIAPSIKLVNDSISMLEDLPMEIGHGINGMTEFVANARNLLTGSNANRVNYAKAVKESSSIVLSKLKDIERVLGKAASGLSPDARDMMVATANQVAKTREFVETLSGVVSTYANMPEALLRGEGAPPPATRTSESLSNILAGVSEDRSLLSGHEKKLAQQLKIAHESQVLLNEADNKVNRLIFDRNQEQKQADKYAKSVLPATEEELRSAFGMETEATEAFSDIRIGREDEGILNEENQDFGHEAGKGSVLAQEMQASGIRLKLDTLKKTADAISNDITEWLRNPEGRSANDVIAEHISKLGEDLDRKGISLEDSVKIQMGMAGVAELAQHPKYRELLKDNTSSSEELVAKVHEALKALNPDSPPEATLMMATHAVENMTGKRVESTKVDTEAIKALAEEQNTFLAKELAEQKRKADLREGGAVTPESVALAIEDARSGNNADKIKALNMAEKLWREQPGTPENFQLRKEARELAPKAGNMSLRGVAMDLAAGVMMAHYSPEGAAVMLGAGTAYVAYKLGMARSAKFADVMGRIKAFPKNTVSEIAAKIKGIAKGISDATARIMASVFKDGKTVDGGPGTKTRTDDAPKPVRYDPTQPLRDEHGYLTPNGKARITEASEAYSDPQTLYAAWGRTPGSMGGRVFSYDVVRGDIIHPEGGLFAWVEGTPGVSKSFDNVILARLRVASRNGENQAIVIGGNGAGKSTFMGSEAAQAQYDLMHELTGARAGDLELRIQQAERLGVPTDMVYILRPLNEMIEGSIVRGINEQRLGYADGFASTLVDGMANTVAAARHEGFLGTLHVVDDASGRTYSGEEAIKRLEGLVQTLDKNDVADRYRAFANQYSLENNNEIPPAVRAWLAEDAKGNISRWVSGVSTEGYLTPTERSAGIQDGARGTLESHTQDPKVLDKGPIGLITSEPVTPKEVAQPYLDNHQDLVKAGESDASAIQYLNSGVNPDEFIKFVGETLDKSKANAKAREQRVDRGVGKGRRSEDPALLKKVTQWVHRAQTDDQHRIMDLMLMKLHDKDQVTGGFQPTLVKYAELKDKDMDQYRSIGKAMTDSSVQERVIKDSELVSRYKLTPESIALYKETVGVLKGIQKITLAAYDRHIEDNIAEMREDQEKLPNDEHYDEGFKRIEKRIADLMDDAESTRHIIQKNPVYVGLHRNDKGTRRLELYDEEGKRIGMTHIDTGKTKNKLTDEQRQQAVDSMLEQMSKRIWHENDMVGTPEAVYAGLKKQYENGKIKAGYMVDGNFVDGESRAILPDDHFNFIKQAGGMVSAESLHKLIENRGADIASDTAQKMMRDLQYLGGSRDIEDRLSYARKNVAGYSEDIIGALSMHASNAGYMISNLKYSSQIRGELTAYRRNRMMSGEDNWETKYREMLNYVLSMNAPTQKANNAVKVMDFIKTYSAWRALAGKPTFGATQLFQGTQTSQLHMMAHYDTNYMGGKGMNPNGLYAKSWNVARKFMGQMMGLGVDLSMVDPIKVNAMMDEAFTYEHFNGIWKSKEEADRMAPIVKEVMWKVIQGSDFKDVNVGMQLNVDDAVSSANERATHTTMGKKAKDAVKDSVGYIANKTENLNRLRDIISYAVACATEGRATDAGKMSGKWAEYGYVKIGDDSYERLTFDDLKAEVTSAMKSKYKDQDISKKDMDAMIHDEVINKITTFAERNSAHSNFNTGRGYGSELIWNPSGNNGTTAFFKTAALFRLFPVNIINAWRTDTAITARRLAAEGRNGGDATIARFKSAAYGSIASMLLGGAFGVPTAGMVTDLLSFICNQIGKLWGKPPVTDVKRDFVDWTRKKMGNYPARFVAAGIFGLTPFYGLGAQLSAGEGPLSWDSKNSFLENAGEQVLGANVGAVKSVTRGIKRFNMGDHVGGIANIVAPVGLSNMIDAYVSDDYAPSRKRPDGADDFYKYSKNGMGGRMDQFAKAMGATPYKSNQIAEEDNTQYRLRDARKALIQDIQDAFEKGNITEHNWKEVQQWNDLMIELERPELTMKPRPASMKSKMKREMIGEMHVKDRLPEEEGDE